MLRASRQQLSGTQLDFLAQLTALWQRQAYAHRRPDDDAVLAMLDQWNRHFARAPGTEPGQ